MTPRAHPLLEQLDNRQLLNGSVDLTTQAGMDEGHIDEACKEASRVEYWSILATNGLVAVAVDALAIGVVVCSPFPKLTTTPITMLVAAGLQIASIGLSSFIASQFPEAECQDESGLQGYFDEAGAWGALGMDIVFSGALALVGVAYWHHSTKRAEPAVIYV